MSKKLVIKDVEFGKVPYGYGNGMSSIRMSRSGLYGSRLSAPGRSST